ncbi:MAG: hypothetical protein A2287_00280 [Candidatus Melainabacteria bacterium RIFOXYA12_FULL_32_12]|nr:MAG: hypothetical protein A2287_00280 [Candidatus Melainabacteria bacterium RIFOXYA12_FULL_32_12]
MSTGRDRNKPCPCGSGKKFKKCCMNKKVRSHIYTYDMGEVVTVNMQNAKILPNGKLQFIDNDKLITPKTVSISRVYERKNKDPKVIFEVPLDPKTQDSDIYRWFKSYDYIFAIDTSTDMTGQNLSVCFHAELQSEPVDEPGLARYTPIFYGPTVFKTPSGIHPEKEALASLIRELIKRLNYKPDMRVAIITDHDLANIPKYNSRELPLIEGKEDTFLPKGFELVYATDKPANESIPNNLIHHLDKLAKKHLKSLLNEYNNLTSVK